jgi:predicted Zn-dependent protease
MKKIFVLLCVVFTLSRCTCFATEIDLTRDGKMQKYVSEIGFKILNANRIDKRMVFYYSDKKVMNAFAVTSNRSIYLFRGMSAYLDSEDEYAAVLSHEISHNVDSYDGVLRGYFSSLPYLLAPRKYEEKADKRAVDYMVKAGYNPVAMIVMMSKIFPQTRFEWCYAHPISSKRMMYVYEYIYKKYPQYLANNTYQNNLYYQNFLLTSRTSRENFEVKMEHAAQKNKI